MYDKMQEIWIKSSKDGTMQPSLLYKSESENRPLLVGLHTWSHNRFNQVERMLPLAVRNDWNLLLPEFRGSNLKENPYCREACGSEKAKQDILDGVAYVREHFAIDEKRIMLLGASGGGHMALLMAAYAPKLWRAVCSFVPITDLEKWYRENADYREQIAACCGGAPAEHDTNSAQTGELDWNPESAEQYITRSPLHYAGQIAQATVKIYSGKWDPIVPCHHGLDLYNQIFREYPEADVYFEMFDGGHEMLLEEAEKWLTEHINREHRQLERVTG